jgi:Tetratricopeptide repeat
MAPRGVEQRTGPWCKGFNRDHIPCVFRDNVCDQRLNLLRRVRLLFTHASANCIDGIPMGARHVGGLDLHAPQSRSRIQDKVVTLTVTARFGYTKSKARGLEHEPHLGQLAPLFASAFLSLALSVPPGALGQKFAEAAAEFQRQLAVTAEVYGAESPENADPLTRLGSNALLQHDYVSAERDYFRALELTEKTLGPTNYRVKGNLDLLAEAYVAQRDFQKGEACLQRALAIDEALYGADNSNLWSGNLRLGDMYSKWGKFKEAEPYYRKLLALHEKDFGADDPRLCPTLEVLATVLTNLGRIDEAQQLRKRSQALMMAMNQKRE